MKEQGASSFIKFEGLKLVIHRYLVGSSRVSRVRVFAQETFNKAIRFNFSKKLTLLSPNY